MLGTQDLQTPVGRSNHWAMGDPHDHQVTGFEGATGLRVSLVRWIEAKHLTKSVVYSLKPTNQPTKGVYFPKHFRLVVLLFLISSLLGDYYYYLYHYFN